MIHPFRFLWEQLNGPQISAIMKAIYEFLKNMFDGKLDHFNNIDIMTCTIGELNTIGAIMNIPRGLVQRVDSVHFFFSELPQGHMNIHGFSMLDSSIGGQFTSVVPVDEMFDLLDATYYRVLLNGIAKGTAYPGSLIYIQQALEALNNAQSLPGVSNDWAIIINDNGSVDIDLGTPIDWEKATYILASMRMLIKTMYGPVPTVNAHLRQYSGE